MSAPRPAPAPAGPASGEVVRLRLYLSGLTERSSRAVLDLKGLCEAEFPGKYALEVVDLHQEPGRAAAEGVRATPTVVKWSPAPVRRFTGDLGDPRRVLEALGLPARAATP